MKLNQILNLVLITVYILCVSYVSSQKEVTCDKFALKRIDELIAKLTTYGNSGRKFPESAEEVPKYCNETKSLVDSIETINKNCIKGLPKQLLSVGMYSIKTMVKKSCRKNSKTTEAEFASAKCVNKAQNELSKCFTKSIDRLLGMVHAEENKKIPLACCEVHKMRECILSLKDKVDICTDEHMQITERFISSVTSNSLNFACNEYSEDSDKCQNLIPPKKRKNQRRTKSMIMAFLRLFESFPETREA